VTAPGEARQTSCGVIVTDGERVLLGHATRSPRWDIPKGLALPGEALLDAALRELREETGLAAPPDALVPHGVHPYRRGKDLALFEWRPAALPSIETLVCTSTFRLATGAELPEFDRFALVPWEELPTRVGKSLWAVLGPARGSL
jgi:8-oxo-dGTP pyrophosphatase MutT (NUDIX family)